MTKKFDQVLSNTEIANIVFPCEWSGNKDQQMACIIAREVEQAILTKLAEQEPVAWVHPTDPTRSITHHQKLGAIKDGGAIEKTTRVFSIPAYAHTMPCVSPTSDKTACVSEKEESETQDSGQGFLDGSNETIECAKCGHPAIHYLVMDNLGYPNKTPLCGDCTQEHEHLAQDTNEHEMRNFGGTYGLVAYHYEPLVTTQPDHIPGAGKMIAPDGWQLVPVEPTLDMIKALRHKAVIAHHGNIVNPSNMIKAALAAAPKLGGGDDC